MEQFYWLRGDKKGHFFEGAEKMEILDANADAPIQIHLPVAGVTPMYRVQFRGFRSRWAAASQGMTPRAFVRAQTQGMDMAEIQEASRIFIEYAFSVQSRPEPKYSLPPQRAGSERAGAPPTR
jgi:hypothetical protein